MTPSRRRTAWLLIAAIAVVVPACGPSSSVATDAEAPAANASRDGHASPAQVAPLDLAWEQLAAFDLVPPAAETPDTADAPATATDETADREAAVDAAWRRVPDAIRALDGRTVTVEGYMLPLESSEAGVRTFFIARHGFGCCFGTVPLPHELVACDVGTSAPVPYVENRTVKVTGALHVGMEEWPVCIYRIDAPVLTVPEQR